jgi:hypothetical protein
MATPLKGGKSAPTEAQPAKPIQPPRILDNPRTNTLAQALKNSQTQVDTAK